MVASKKADFDAISAKFNIDKVLARIIRNRDVVEDGAIDLFLNGTPSDFHDPLLMKDMEQAACIVKDRISKNRKIRIIGDYDVDGICATFILLRALTFLGANVDTVIPHRIKDGYGLNDNLIQDAKTDGVELIITCDNGIAASDQVKLANELGMEVIVTDHHEVPYDTVDGKKQYIIPPALCIVDPKQEDCTYPYPNICGAFVAYKLVSVLLKESPDREIISEELLSFAALATVCDVMDLKDENRILVKYGLKSMPETRNVGLKALISVTGLDQKVITNYHAGFILGPCLNATGRLDTAKRALSLFETSSYSEALIIANELKELNDERKAMTEEGAKKASDILVSNNMTQDHVLVIYLKDTHESLAGIIAGRIKEKYNRPTIVLTDGEDGVKGSGRSIETYDMYAELTKVKDLFTKFGGHKMAAGVSLNCKEDIDILRKRLNENECLSEDDLTIKVHIDVPMPVSYVSKEFVRNLDILEPFGVANPKPVFATKNISLILYSKLGKNKNVGKFKISDENGRMYEMIYFGDLERFEEYVTEKYGKAQLDNLLSGRCNRGDCLMDIVYYPEINSFRGTENIQIVMNHYR